jgi:hypothetical protein
MSCSSLGVAKRCAESDAEKPRPCVAWLTPKKSKGGLPYVPEHQLTVAAGVGQERWLAMLSATYVSLMRGNTTKTFVLLSRFKNPSERRT